jgi:hypothetical protein
VADNSATFCNRLVSETLFRGSAPTDERLAATGLAAA